jgi:hypothetical protein
MQAEISPLRRRRRATMSCLIEKIPRITRTLVLAHQIEQVVRESRVGDCAEIARQLGVSRARVCQVIGLLRLAPAIQERILLDDPGTIKHLSEAPLRRVFLEADHRRQVEMFDVIIDRIKKKPTARAHPIAKSVAKPR